MLRLCVGPLLALILLTAGCGDSEPREGVTIALTVGGSSQAFANVRAEFRSGVSYLHALRIISETEDEVLLILSLLTGTDSAADLARETLKGRGGVDNPQKARAMYRYHLLVSGEDYYEAHFPEITVLDITGSEPKKITLEGRGTFLEFVGRESTGPDNRFGKEVAVQGIFTVPLY